jgi:exonuclease III
MQTNVYGPTQNNLKAQFLNEIRTIACLHDLTWIILGDFNIIRNPNDSSSTNPNTHSMIPFNDLISDLDLQKKQLNGRSFTWSNMRRNPTLSKLDRIFLSNHRSSLTNLIPYLSDVPTATSDHVPITLKFHDQNRQRHRAFFFERHWLQFSEALDIVHTA